MHIDIHRLERIEVGVAGDFGVEFCFEVEARNGNYQEVVELTLYPGGNRELFRDVNGVDAVLAMLKCAIAEYEQREAAEREADSV